MVSLGEKLGYMVVNLTFCENYILKCVIRETIKISILALEKMKNDFELKESHVV